MISKFPFIKAVIKAIIPNGDTIADTGEEAKNIYTNFKAYEEKINKGEIDVINDYVKWCEQKKGFIYERDEITSLLTDLISRVKQKTNNKPILLIIDDLDRLDPDHVFRLFNVFSAHYDAATDVNKFGLDKVVFVCDYDNIHLMYEHRYGNGVDFEGYINKFYSTKTFNFNPKKHFLESIQEILIQKPTTTDLTKYKLYAPFRSDNYFVISLTLIFSDLIKHNFLTFRNLAQFKEYQISSYEISIDGHSFNASRFYIITFINLISQSISLQVLEDVLEKLSSIISPCTTKQYKDNSQTGYLWLIRMTLPLFISGQQLKGYRDDKETSINVGGIDYKLSLRYSFDLDMVIPELDMPAETEYNVFKFLQAAIIIGKTNNLFD